MIEKSYPLTVLAWFSLFQLSHRVYNWSALSILDRYQFLLTVVALPSSWINNSVNLSTTHRVPSPNYTTPCNFGCQNEKCFWDRRRDLGKRTKKALNESRVGGAQASRDLSGWIHGTKRRPKSINFHVYADILSPYIQAMRGSYAAASTHSLSFHRSNEENPPSLPLRRPPPPCLAAPEVTPSSSSFSSGFCAVSC